MSSRSTKVYVVFPSGTGFSSKTIDYHGVAIYVAAVSIKQAYYLAGNRVWVDDIDQPRGIIQHYQRGGDPRGWYRLWDGCLIHGGLSIEHGDGKRKIIAGMREHLLRQHDDGDETVDDDPGDGTDGTGQLRLI